MKEKYHLISGDDHDHQQIIQILEDKLYEYNSEKIDKTDGHLFSRVIRSGRADIIAGIAGWTWADICEITQFWVDASHRKNGIGKMLLEAAEAEAKSQGCRSILIRTYSFQAPEFYRKHGYRTEHIINDFPPGHRYYLLTKALENKRPAH